MAIVASIVKHLSLRRKVGSILCIVKELEDLEVSKLREEVLDPESLSIARSLRFLAACLWIKDKLGDLVRLFPEFADNGETRRVEGQLGGLGQLGPLTLTYDHIFDQDVLRGYLSSEVSLGQQLGISFSKLLHLSCLCDTCMEDSGGSHGIWISNHEGKAHDIPGKDHRGAHDILDKGQGGMAIICMFHDNLCLYVVWYFGELTKFRGYSFQFMFQVLRFLIGRAMDDCRAYTTCFRMPRTTLI
ncbi:uncharacterized protein LOC111910516 [Lactuca sativa]|uniref:uncharacterized protein LOC111910516 n=1 Tax=Lactuca sativa TaxID=4236 RepID=UPI000CD82FED|nr:uncharacterized protein LOC111910516 [Lactuca sativa]